MQKANLVWLASYPKSGNTWFRAFLFALLHEPGDIDLNGLKTDGIFSSRAIFNSVTDLDSTYLTDEEVKLLIPHVYRFISNETDRPLYMKVHDAFTTNCDSQAIIPADATMAAIYIIRNPLDIVASFANHMGRTFDDAISLMNNHHGSIAKQKNNLNLNEQFRQLLMSWSDHVQSWTDGLPFPVLVIRFEDMLNDPLRTFSKAIEFIGITTTPEKISEAISVTRFSKLQEKEKEKGFKEKTAKAKQFFRSGSAGNWKSELTTQQAASIVETHAAIMQRFGYDINIPV